MNTELYINRRFTFFLVLMMSLPVLRPPGLFRTCHRLLVPVRSAVLVSPVQSRNTNCSSRFGSTVQLRTVFVLPLRRCRVRPGPGPGPSAACGPGTDPAPRAAGTRRAVSSCFTSNMLKLRNAALRSAAALRSPAAAAAQVSQHHAHFSTSRQKLSPFYEFRTYSIRPDQNAAFLKLTNEKIHLRTAHSELIGYWSIEYGGLNKVFHIWKYDSYFQRAGVRAGLAQDPTWMSEYISKAMPMLTSQDNEVTYLLPWSHLQRPPQEGGVFELASFQMRPGGPTVWGDAVQAAVTAHNAPGYGKLVGAFQSEFGPGNRVHALWWFKSADERAEAQHKVQCDPGVAAAVRNAVVHLDFQENKLMFPCTFSPIK